MKHRPLAAALTLALLCTPALAASPPDGKAAIAKALSRELRGDFTRHNRAEVLAAIRPVDIDGDGIGDWQVDFNAFGSAWCGTGGCRYQLWLGRKGGAPRKVFDRQMRELEIVKRGGRTVFVFDFHGSQCGGFGAQACPGEFAWDARRGRMVLLSTPRKHTGVSDPLSWRQ